MMSAYLITEGKTDESLLKSLLPKDIVQGVSFITAGGRYGSLSLARSILAVRQAPVALVVDADTDNPALAAEQEDFLRESLRQASPGIPFEVFVVIPALEAILTSSRSVLERLLGQSVSDEEFTLARSNPKQFLLSRAKGDSPLSLMGRLDSQELNELKTHPLLQRITEFLASLGVKIQ